MLLRIPSLGTTSFKAPEPFILFYCFFEFFGPLIVSVRCFTATSLFLSFYGRSPSKFILPRYFRSIARFRMCSIDNYNQLSWNAALSTSYLLSTSHIIRAMILLASLYVSIMVFLTLETYTYTFLLSSRWICRYLLYHIAHLQRWQTSPLWMCIKSQTSPLPRVVEYTGILLLVPIISQILLVKL